MAKAKNAISLGISAIIVIAFILIVGFGLFLNATFNTIQTTSIGITQTSNSSLALTTTSSKTSPTVTTTMNTSTTCSEQFGNLCPYNWTAYFWILVNYTSEWNVSYIATSTGINNLSGNYKGTGDNSTQIVVHAHGFGVMTFCATAQKMDSSNSTLLLGIDLQNPAQAVNTSLPFGSVQKCVGEGI